jgi:hypothetical protein
MMGHTFGVIKERADEEWKFGRLKSVLEATERMSPLPPPFNLPLTVYFFVKEHFFSQPLDNNSGEVSAEERAATSKAKKTKQKTARKLLLKYKLQLENNEDRHEEKEELMQEKIDFLIKEVLELKKGSLESAIMTEKVKTGRANTKTAAATK